jgi:hypothetical protein
MRRACIDVPPFREVESALFCLRNLRSTTLAIVQLGSGTRLLEQRLLSDPINTSVTGAEMSPVRIRATGGLGQGTDILARRCTRPSSRLLEKGSSSLFGWFGHQAESCTSTRRSGRGEDWEASLQDPTIRSAGLTMVPTCGGGRAEVLGGPTGRTGTRLEPDRGLWWSGDYSMERFRSSARLTAWISAEGPC